MENLSKIKRVAVLGSGVMGSRIACHFANVGCEVLLMDILPNEASDNPKIDRNQVAKKALDAVLKEKPSPIYSKNFTQRISFGNFTDDWKKINNCDWIIEAVVERLDIKQSIFQEVDLHRRKDSIVSTNTSGIPIHLMTQERSENFKANFLGVHFFNPPRYLPLLEIIPTKDTQPNIVNFIHYFGREVLGKQTVTCKDTPAFIANRIGVFGISYLFHLVEELDFSLSEIDFLTGPIIGRPKSGTFRTCDVVGLDTLVHVANGLQKACPNDENNAMFILPEYITKMLDKNLLGSKTKAGFYKKELIDGKKVFLNLDLNTLEYKSAEKPKFKELEQILKIESTAERIKQLLQLDSKIGVFYRKIFASLFAYVSMRVPEISDDLDSLDTGVCAGFGWEIGPFETWQYIGFEAGKELIKNEGLNCAEWVFDSALNVFFDFKKDEVFAYNVATKSLQKSEARSILSLKNLPESALVWTNGDTKIHDIGDGVINLSFHTKMNTIGEGVIQGIHKAIDLAESTYKGLVISNEGEQFSAGANVGLIFMLAIEQEVDELHFAVQQFQETMMRVRYSKIPVVVAPHNLALGGGCELSMHSDCVVAHSELYMGLVEFGIGVIPGGGGTKEFAKRLSQEIKNGDIKINAFRERFLTIGQAKVSTSAEEAFELGYLRKGIDEIVTNRKDLLVKAKQKVISLSQKGYLPPLRSEKFEVLGNEALGIVYIGAHTMLSGNYMSEHDLLISHQLGHVLSGGELSKPTYVSEDYLLRLERQAFVELCMQPKTLARMESLLKFGKILRN